MIDTLFRHLSKAKKSAILNDLELLEAGQVKPYAVLTLHRPANVDDSQKLAKMLDAFLEISRHMPIIFPAHPRTLRQIQDADLGGCFVDHSVKNQELWDPRGRIRLVPPLGYLDFLQLASHAKLILTDSGGVQEETTILGVPCITLRENTERPVTLSCGTNVLTGADADKIVAEFTRVLKGAWQQPATPYLWDGQAAKRVVQILSQEQDWTQSGKALPADASLTTDRPSYL
jgi:UDP-N-acetylglucosamine 2-epimerase (non-hydrolysing)